MVYKLKNYPTQICTKSLTFNSMLIYIDKNQEQVQKKLSLKRLEEG